MSRRQARRYCLIAALLSGLLLVWLAWAMTVGIVAPADAALRDGIQLLQAEWLTSVLARLTVLGSVTATIILSGLAFAGFWAFDRRGDAKALAWTMFASLLLENGMKYSFQRPRPEPFFNLPLPGSYSFPSGHALFATCLYVSIAWGIAAMSRSLRARRLVWAAALALIAGIGFSRMYLGVHYPSDVAAGWLAGCLCVLSVRGWTSHSSRPRMRSTVRPEQTEQADDEIWPNASA